MVAEGAPLADRVDKVFSVGVSPLAAARGGGGGLSSVVAVVVAGGRS